MDKGVDVEVVRKVLRLHKIITSASTGAYAIVSSHEKDSDAITIEI